MSGLRHDLWRSLANARGRVSEEDLRRTAAEHGLSLLHAQQEVCAAACLPQRYARNAATLSPEEQGMLLHAHVLLVGLGGLGGHIVDMLARMGVGHITGVDGDSFEESNANRQLLCTAASMGHGKALAAARHVALINGAVVFTPVPHFVQGEDFAPLVAQAHVVVDALGGLTHRAALHAAALHAGKPVVSAGIAGLTGWLAVVRPGSPSPLALLGQGVTSAAAHATPPGISSGISSHATPPGSSSCLSLDASPDTPPSAEELLGNLAPTATTAAALQCAEILKLLTGRPALQDLLLFDLEDQSFTRVLL